MTRHKDWEKRLAAVIEQAKGRGFAWGQQDCALFACDCILAMTGVDLAAPLRGTYDSTTSALTAIREFVGREDATVEDVAMKQTQAHGMPEVKPLSAHRGDVCSVDSPTGPALGMVGLEGSHVLVVGKQGLTRVPLSQARRAWRVG